MFARNAPARRAAIAALLLSAACYRSTAPSDWLPRAHELEREAYGAWIDVGLAQGGRVLGELIAAHDDSLFVLAADRLVGVAVRDVAGADLTTFAQPWGELAVWGGIGAISALSHGWFWIFSLPAWGATTAIAAATASRAPRIRSIDPARLRPYARFPQGLPPTLDRGALRGKGR